MLRKSLVVATAALIGLLAACETEVPGPSFPELTYGHLPPLRLAVNSIDIVQQYSPPAESPHVEHLFPVRPAETAARWVRDRLEAAGGPAELRAVIVTASVVEVPLEQSGGIRGAFTTEQSERYDGELEMRLEIEDPAKGRTATVTARAERRRTVPEDISLADREKVWFEMTEAMMNDLNDSLERQIRENFRPWLR